MARKIFVSYPSESRTKARELADLLARRGLEPWFDTQSMARGAWIEPELRRAISESACCVLVLSAHTEASPWCLMEAGAFWGADKRIVVYRTEPALLPPTFLVQQRVADSPDEALEAVLDALREDPTSMRATLARSGVTSAFRIPVQNPWRQTRVAELVLEEGRRAHPTFRLLASSGYNYLHPQGNVWKSGLGELVVGGAQLDVVLQSPFSPAAEARARANDLEHDQWIDRGMIPAILEHLRRPNVRVHVTEQPVNCSLFFTSRAVLYDPYLWGRPKGGRTENNFWVLEFGSEPDDTKYGCYAWLEGHFQFLDHHSQHVREVFGDDLGNYQSRLEEFRARIRNSAQGRTTT